MANCEEFLIELKGIKKYYDREVLHVEQLLFKKGHVYGVIGPSGAGKSTLLRIINLLTPPDSGTLLFHDQPAVPFVHEN